MMQGRLGEFLRQAREASERSQAEVAAAAGVGQSMVSLYEHGHREPTWQTFDRLARAAGVVPEVTLSRLRESSVTLADIAELMKAAKDDDRRQRLVLDFVGRYDFAPTDSRRALMVDRPQPTGDSRWDAFLGALAEHLAFREAFDAPSWCTDADRFLTTAWYWVDLPSVRRRALVHAPAAFRRRNVWIDPVDLVRV